MKKGKNMSNWAQCPNCGTVMTVTTSGYLCPMCGTALPVKILHMTSGTSPEVNAVPVVKRSQLDRITIAEALLSDIWKEFEDGKIDTKILQTAVYCQMDINRIVWKLNNTEKR